MFNLLWLFVSSHYNDTTYCRTVNQLINYILYHIIQMNIATVTKITEAVIRILLKFIPSLHSWCHLV